MNQFLVIATLNSILKKQFIVNVPDAVRPSFHAAWAITQVERFNHQELCAGDAPLYPTGCELGAEPLEFIGMVCVL